MQIKVMTFKLVSQRWPLQHEARRRGRRGRRGWIPPSRQQSAARFLNYKRNHFGLEVVLRKTNLPMVGHRILEYTSQGTTKSHHG